MRLIGLAVMALCLTATAAHAEACKTHGSPAAQAVVLPSGDSERDIRWGLSTGPTVTDEALADIFTRPAGCVRAGFVEGGVQYDVSGDADDPLPRLVRRADRQGAAFAIVPFIDIGAMMEGGAIRYAFGLVMAEGTTVRLHRIYDLVPDDARLAQDVRLALAGKLPIYAQAQDKQVTVFIHTPPEDADPKVALKGQCDGQGATDAQVVVSAHTFHSELITHTAAASAAIAVGKKTVPRKLAAADRKPCTRATFNAGGAEYELRGGGQGLLARYAVAQDASRPGGYLLRVPSLADALAWRAMNEKARKAFAAQAHAYMLAADGAERRLVVFQFYDKIPDDERLARDMSRVLTRADPLFALIPGSDHIAVYRPDDPPPIPGEGDNSQVTQSRGPDGTVFLAGDDGDAVHAATRFVCPREIADYSREVIIVFDPRDGGRDAACRYRNQTGWFTLYLTRAETGADAAEIYQLYELQAKTVAPPMVSLPPLPGLSKAAPHMAFWVDAQGQSQSIQVKRYGDWYVKQRGTASTPSGMVTAGGTVFKQADALFAAP